MSIFTGVQCDKCKREHAWDVHLGKLHLIAWAREDGWSHGKQDLCPNCKRKQKKVTK